MSRRKYISYRSLLAAIIIGLNVLFLLAVTYGRYVDRLTRVNYSHIPAQGMGRGRSRTGRGSETVVASDPVPVHATADSGNQSTSATPTTPSFAVGSADDSPLQRPTFMAELLVRENVLAPGSAPHAPGLGRAPPIAALYIFPKLQVAPRVNG